MPPLTIITRSAVGGSNPLESQHQKASKMHNKQKKYQKLPWLGPHVSNKMLIE
jgi:hypothetical protein